MGLTARARWSFARSCAAASFWHSWQRCRPARWPWRRAAAVIPPKANRRAIIGFDRNMYRWRHLIENTFAKLKEFSAVATRYDKTDTSYTATIHLAAAIITSR